MLRDVHKDFILHDILQDIVSHDISVFFHQKLGDVKREHDGLSTPWPGVATLELLVERAAGLFIYAATTCRFIRHGKFHPKNDFLASFKHEAVQSP